ncbi:MAG: TMEM198/TM7SF3 family protein [Candidatus Hydrogenedentes bacterium]|nr:TMEM198/TM7SF3 family protein [Candidatus Hydrogenedentota bacterium]
MNLEILLQQEGTIGILISILLLGGITCFYGYKLISAVLCVVGFIMGSIPTFLILGSIPNLPWVWIVVFAVFFGFLGAVASLFLFSAGVFLLGVVWGISVSITLQPLLDPPIFMFIFGLLGGISALIIEKPVIILSTASIGGILILWSLLQIGETLHLIEGPPTSYYTNFYFTSFLTWLGFAILGSAIQFKLAYSK